MAYEEIKNIDIYEYPSECTDVEGGEITIGDIHANPMLLLYMLTCHKVINITENDYASLAGIYQMKPLDKCKFNEFVSIIEKITINSKPPLIRLIGDDLADRGENDYFILKIIEKLDKNLVPLEIILSNHGIEFIEAYEKIMENGEGNLLSERLGKGVADSLTNLNKAMAARWVEFDEVMRLYEQCYRPHLKMISIGANDDDNRPVLYSHAVIGLETVQNLLDQTAYDYNVTEDNLEQAVAHINQRFKIFAKHNQIHKMYKPALMREAGKTTNCAFDSLRSHQDPVAFTLWNRYSNLDLSDAQELNNESTDDNLIIFNKGNDSNNYYYVDRPDSIVFCHGHDGYEQTDNNIINLDSDLGKFTSEYKNIEWSKGTDTDRLLKLLYTPTNQLNLNLNDNSAVAKAAKLQYNFEAILPPKTETQNFSLFRRDGYKLNNEQKNYIGQLKNSLKQLMRENSTNTDLQDMLSCSSYTLISFNTASLQMGQKDVTASQKLLNKIIAQQNVGGCGGCSPVSSSMSFSIKQ